MTGWETEVLSERQKRRKDKELGTPIRRPLWDRLSTIQWEGILAAITGFHFDDEYPSGGIIYIPNKEFAHRLTIGIVSAGICGTGIGQLLELFRG